ncbi:MAG TPA: hypothetical protein VN408_19815, partial [Actinoplanes sp.]|nr:hypothetical protein [Actinoplanes sp.]
MRKLWCAGALLSGLFLFGGTAAWAGPANEPAPETPALTWLTPDGLPSGVSPKLARHFADVRTEFAGMPGGGTP